MLLLVVDGNLVVVDCTLVGSKMVWCCCTIDILNDLLSGPKKLRRDWKKLCSDHIRTAEAKGLRMDGIYYGDRFCVLKLRWTKGVY